LGNRRNRTISGKKLIVGASSFIVGLATIVATVYAYRAYTNQSTSDVAVVGFEVTNHSQVPYVAREPSGAIFGTGKEEAAGAAITLRNSGQVPALLTKVKVEVLDLLSMEGCWGAGGVETTAEYDIRVPDDIASRAPPRYVEKQISFQVEGQKVDQLAITIGPSIEYDGRWPNIYVVDIWLVEHSGEEIGAGRAVLMDAGYSDAILEYASAPETHFGDSVPRCISNNVVLLDRALGMVSKERQSAEAVSLRDKLKALGYGSNISPPSAEARPVAGEESVNSWILQLSSVPISRSSDEIERARADTEQKLGLPVRVLDSSDFASLNPGFWVLYHPGNYPNGIQALDACAAGGSELDGQCVGRYLSHNAADRALTCYPSSPSGRQSHCTK
jgi:hypothetical protein